MSDAGHDQIGCGVCGDEEGHGGPCPPYFTMKAERDISLMEAATLSVNLIEAEEQRDAANARAANMEAARNRAQTDLIELEDQLRLLRARVRALAVHSPETGTAAVPTQRPRCVAPLGDDDTIGPREPGYCDVYEGAEGGRCRGVCAVSPGPAECTCYEITGGHQPGCYFNRPAVPAAEPGKPVTTPRQDCLNSCHLVLRKKDWCGVCRGTRP